jgi:hypothetical protein
VSLQGALDHAEMLRKQGLSVPTPNPNLTITIQHERKLQPAQSAVFVRSLRGLPPGFPHPPVGQQWLAHLCKLFEELV